MKEGILTSQREDQIFFYEIVNEETFYLYIRNNVGLGYLYGFVKYPLLKKKQKTHDIILSTLNKILTKINLT